MLFLPLVLMSAIAGGGTHNSGFDKTITQNARVMLDEGRQIFRYDTFGDEAYWGDTLRLHEAIKGEALGGVGPGVSPKTALEVGLKVDVDALPEDVLEAIKAGDVDLEDPATTVTLVKLNSVVGVQGFFDEAVNLESMVLNSWGPGMYDAELNMDGKAFRPDGTSAATLIPPAFGLVGVNLSTWNGWGSVTYWNAYVANTQMRGQGTFFDPRLNNPEKYPVAAATGDWNIRHTPDLVTPKLPALHFYQLAIPAPKPPQGSFDQAAAVRGEKLFNGVAKCASCHVAPTYSEPGWAMHTAEELGIDDFQAARSPDERYRTAPLKGLWSHTKGGFYHDGRFATLEEVIQHYNNHFELELDEQQVDDLIQFLLSL